MRAASEQKGRTKQGCRVYAITSSFWPTSSALNAPQSESKRMGPRQVRDETRVDLQQNLGTQKGRQGTEVMQSGGNILCSWPMGTL